MQLLGSSVKINFISDDHGYSVHNERSAEQGTFSGTWALRVNGVSFVEAE